VQPQHQETAVTRYFSLFYSHPNSLDQTIVQYLKYQDLGKCLIEFNEIQQFEKIGQGGFGEVTC